MPAKSCSIQTLFVRQMYSIVNGIIEDQLTSDTKPFDLFSCWTRLWFIQNHPYNYTMPSYSNQSIHIPQELREVRTVDQKRINILTLRGKWDDWPNPFDQRFWWNILDLQFGFWNRPKIENNGFWKWTTRPSLIMNTALFIIIHLNVKNNCTLCSC